MCNRDVQLGTTTEHLPQYPKGLGVYPMLQEISKETSVIDRIKDKTGNLNHTTRCVIKILKKKKNSGKFLLPDIRQYKTYCLDFLSLLKRKIF